MQFAIGLLLFSTICLTVHTSEQESEDSILTPRIRVHLNDVARGYIVNNLPPYIELNERRCIAVHRLPVESGAMKLYKDAYGCLKLKLRWIISDHGNSKFDIPFFIDESKLGDRAEEILARIDARNGRREERK